MRFWCCWRIRSGAMGDYVRAAWAAGSTARTLTFTSTRDPSLLMINKSRSVVNRPRLALRIREKSAAATPVRSCAPRTVRRCQSSAVSAGGKSL